MLTKVALISNVDSQKAQLEAQLKEKEPQLEKVAKWYSPHPRESSLLTTYWSESTLSS